TTDGETMTFTTEDSNNDKSMLALNLSNGRNVIDRAIVRFGEGSQLPKFQLNPNHTKVYIPQDNKDYAIVNATEMGEMPVSFKAENNGSYILSINAEEVSFAYLHLIDNKTGDDVDLLATPSYSFEARTTDYANRFRLVFATGDNSNDDNFAFFSNGSFVINNEGMATVQVIDVNGRILSSESINGCANVSVNAAAGVYMIRLVNGENVKVQKVVVR
ncbi:MAG: T9SS type A sorting domain-containing protein, partial [Muribaculaceae bacterium]|nr:T9SS type A sorting domain-containing protein [Muribaculaceae bacterium]